MENGGWWFDTMLDVNIIYAHLGLITSGMTILLKKKKMILGFTICLEEC
uniref:Uncharacterized protein n=1 Tax=Glycine max TaxID=3847 RepID=C6T7P1_SOYBN|nr:unknown [Glycine max]